MDDDILDRFDNADERYALQRGNETEPLIHHELAALRARLEEAEREGDDNRLFPISDGPSVPWKIMRPFEQQCRINHSQSLETIADRGGFSSAEAWCVVNGIVWRDALKTWTPDRLKELWCQYASPVAQLQSELAAYRLNFDLHYKACLRGEQMFLSAHPEYRERLALPGTDRLVCWLLEQLAAYESRDETWRGKKEMLENDLAKAWERAERAERALVELRETWVSVSLAETRDERMNMQEIRIAFIALSDAIYKATNKAILLANEPESWKESKDGME